MRQSSGAIAFWCVVVHTCVGGAVPFVQRIGTERHDFVVDTATSPVDGSLASVAQLGARCAVVRQRHPADEHAADTGRLLGVVSVGTPGVEDIPTAITVDEAGFVYVSGTTQGVLPATRGPFCALKRCADGA